ADRRLHHRRLFPRAHPPDPADLAPVRAPQLAGEADVVAVLRVDAGDARVLAVARAVIAGPFARDQLVLRRPDDNAAGVVAGEAGARTGAGCERQEAREHENGGDGACHGERTRRENPMCGASLAPGRWPGQRQTPNCSRRMRSSRLWPGSNSRLSEMPWSMAMSTACTERT